MTSGDVLKASAKHRPVIVGYLDEFGIKRSTKERARVSKISEAVSDYDPAGKFAYLMYSSMLAIGDDGVDDLVAYNYYMGTLGELTDEVEESYISFLETIHNIADEELSDTKGVRLKMAEQGETFEERTIRQIRATFMDGKIFQNAVEEVGDDLQIMLLKGISAAPDKFEVLIKSLHEGVRGLVNIHVPDNERDGILSQIDENYPMSDIARAEDIIKDFNDKIGPIIEIMANIKELDDGNLDVDVDVVRKSVEEHFDTRSGQIAEAMVLIRRTTMYVGALYMMIGTGRLGLQGNKSLAYAIRDVLTASHEKAERSQVNVLKLEKMTSPDMPINLN